MWRCPPQGTGGGGAGTRCWVSAAGVCAGLGGSSAPWAARCAAPLETLRIQVATTLSSIVQNLHKEVQQNQEHLTMLEGLKDNSTGKRVWGLKNVFSSLTFGPGSNPWRPPGKGSRVENINK